MTQLSADYQALANYRPTHKVRFVTAASLFDGHDAAINIMRRILQGMGAEVIHLGHNRSVDDVVTAALQEDAQGIAISSYQGGHVEYFKYMVDLLRERGGEHIQVFGGGGGVIVPAEIRELQALRRGPHLQPRRRPAHGAGRHDRRDGDALRQGHQRLRTHRSRGHSGPRRNALARAGAAHHRGGKRPGSAGAAGSVARSGGWHQDAGAWHHRHRWRGQIVADRRADPPHSAGPGRRAAHRRDLHRPVAPQERRRPAGRPHPHERDRPLVKLWERGFFRRAVPRKNSPLGGSDLRSGERGGSESSCAAWPRATPAARSAPPCPTCWRPARWRAST